VVRVTEVRLYMHCISRCFWPFLPHFTWFGGSNFIYLQWFNI